MTKRARGSASIYEREGSSILWIKYMKNGRPIRESTGTCDRRKAQKLLSLRLAQCATDTFHGLDVERVKVDELIDSVLRDYRKNGKRSVNKVESRWRINLKPWFGGMRAVAVTSDQIERYIDSRLGSGAMPATINRELAVLKRAFNLGRMSTPHPKVTRVPAFPHLEENNVRQGFLEDHQFDKLVEGTDLWFRCLVECGSTIGWRLQEFLTLKVRQVDLEHRMLRLEPGMAKNREGRNAPMSEPMFRLLAACCFNKADDEFVFTRPDGSVVRDMRKAWFRARTRAGLPNLLFHDLRRTAARNLRRHGIAESTIKAIGGRKTTSVFHRYAITNDKDMVDAMRQFEESKARMTRSPQGATERSAAETKEADDGPLM